MENAMGRIEFPPWQGEFGWEVMSWAPCCRRDAVGHDEVVVTSFAGMAPLYADFATEFKCHDLPHRSLDYPKGFEHYHRPGAIFQRYGNREDAAYCFDILLHSRGIARKNSINYQRWSEVIEGLRKLPVTFAVIGSDQDQRIDPLASDERGLELQKLMNLIARSNLVVGASSGVMHLAAACGTDLVVWGDAKTRYRQPLEQRYKETWNPFGVKVGWIDAEFWQPEPGQIVEAVAKMLSGRESRVGADSESHV
jgi:hypothetical protein